MKSHIINGFPPIQEELSIDEMEELVGMKSMISSEKSAFNDLSQRTRTFVVRAGLIASLGGLAFGYDLGNVAGALPLLEKEMNFDHDMSELFVATMPIGAAFGTTIGGWMCDKMGRKKSILITCVIFIAGGLIQSMGSSFKLLCIGRLITGIGVATSAIADVSYLNEVSPTSIRGALTSCNEFMISLGFLLSYLIAVGLSAHHQALRLLFGIIPIIALIQGLLMQDMPESPRWLYNEGKHLELQHTILNMYDVKEAQSQLDLLKSEEDCSQEMSSVTTMWKHQGQFLAWAIAALLMIFQQLTCNSNVLSYGLMIFPNNAHSTKDRSFIVTLGIVKVLFTGVALYFVDKIGRKPMLYVGTSIMYCSLVIVSCSISYMEFPVGNFMARSAIYALVASYSMSYGPVSWLIVSEMFPSSVKGRALALAQFLNWLVNAGINSIFLSSLDNFGYTAVYGTYAFFTFLGLIFIWMLVPETSCKCPEEIQNELQHKSFCQCKRLFNLSDRPVQEDSIEKKSFDDREDTVQYRVF